MVAVWVKFGGEKEEEDEPSSSLSTTDVVADHRVGRASERVSFLLLSLRKKNDGFFSPPELTILLRQAWWGRGRGREREREGGEREGEGRERKSRKKRKNKSSL